MNEYNVTFARSARRELELLDNQIMNRILARIESLSQSPRPRGCIRVRGSENLWRIRVGNYRVIYAIYDQEEVVDIVAVRDRREAYR